MLLASLAGMLDPLGAAAARDELDRGSLDDLHAGTDRAREDLHLVRTEIEAAGARVERHNRLAAFGTEVDRLYAAVLGDAIEGSGP